MRTWRSYLWKISDLWIKTYLFGLPIANVSPASPWAKPTGFTPLHNIYILSKSTGSPTPLEQFRPKTPIQLSVNCFRWSTEEPYELCSDVSQLMNTFFLFQTLNWTPYLAHKFKISLSNFYKIPSQDFPVSLMHHYHPWLELRTCQRKSCSTLQLKK